MDDVRGVRARERIGDRDADADAPRCVPARHQRAHRLAVDELHDDEIDPVRRGDVV